MKINELAANNGFPELTVEVVRVDAPREFSKFGKTGRLAEATVKDDTGEVKFVLWNEQIDQVKEGMSIKIVNGYCKEWKGDMQISLGRAGTIEVLS